MKFIDPFSAKCEFCNSKALYPVKDLLVYKAECTKCGARLIEAPKGMNRSIREHQRNIWPIMFLWEVITKFDVDLDAISDEEFDGITHLSKLHLMINRVRLNAPAVEQQEILDLPALKNIRDIVGMENLKKYSFEEMALLIYPKELED